MKLTTALNRTEDVEIGDKSYKVHRLTLVEIAGLGQLLEKGDLTINEIINGLLEKEINGLWTVAKVSTDVPDEELAKLDTEGFMDIFMYAFGLDKKKL